jgi:acyl-CoA synthetase (AMP-forming)/AMP-acid ligase II
MHILQSLRLAKGIASNGQAIIFEDTRFTWEKFDQRTGVLARGLKSIGMQRGDRVAALMLNSELMLDLYYACARIGAVLVPLSTRMNRFEILYILNQSEAKIFFIDEHFAFCSQGRSAFANVRYIVSTADRHPEGTIRYKDLMHIGHHITFDVDEEIHDDAAAALIYTCKDTEHGERPQSKLLAHTDLQWNMIEYELAGIA